MADGGLLLPIFGGVAYSGPFAAMIAAERALGLDSRTRSAGSARSRSPSPRMPSGSRRACGCPMPRPRRWIPWAIAGGGSPAWTRRRARRRLYRLGEERYRDRLMLAWARAGGGRRSRALAASSRTLPERWTRAEISAQGGRLHRARRRRRARRSGSAGAGGGRLACGGFSAGRAALDAIADQAVARLTREPKP